MTYPPDPPCLTCGHPKSDHAIMTCWRNGHSLWCQCQCLGFEPDTFAELLIASFPEPPTQSNEK